jgi:hypothetical protein
VSLQLPIIMYLNVRLQEHITKHEIIKKMGNKEHGCCQLFSTA